MITIIFLFGVWATAFFKTTFCQINLLLWLIIFSIYSYIYLDIYNWSFEDLFLTALVLLQVFSWSIFCVFKMQHCHVSINAERIGCVVVKLFVFFSFILFTGFIGFYLSHGRISLGHPNSSVPKIGIIHSILCILNSLQVLKKPLPVAYFHTHYSNNLKMF